MVLVVLLSGLAQFTMPTRFSEVSETITPVQSQSDAPLAQSQTDTPMAQSQTDAPPLRKIECYCTDKTGGRVELGDLVCLNVGGRIFLARCEMSLNNPMWREVTDGCVSASLLDDEAFDRG